MSGDRRSARPSAELARTLGVPQIVFMVIAMAAPLTVVAGLIPIMIASGNGSGAPLDFVVIGIVLLLFTVGFSAMTPEVTDAGAFYSYVQKGLGRVPGLATATLAIATYVAIYISVAAYLGAAIHNVLATLTGAEVPWWLLAALCLAIVAYLGYRNVEMSARVLGVLLVAEMTIVLILDGAIAWHSGDSGLSGEPLTWGAFAHGQVGTGIMFAVFGFIGFEATAVFRSEAKDPDRTIPRATYAAVSIIGAVYTVSAWAIVVGAGTAKVAAMAGADPEGLTADLATRYVGMVAHDGIQVLLSTSFFACVLTVHNVVSRYLHTLGRQEILPAKFGNVHRHHRSPHYASSVTSIVVSAGLAVMVLAGLDPVVQIYAWFGGAGTLGLIVLMSLTSIAVVVHFRRTPRGVSRWRGTIAPGLASVCLLATLVLVLRNFPLLIGSPGAADAFLIYLALAFAAGLAWAIRRRTAIAAATIPAADDTSV